MSKKPLTFTEQIRKLIDESGVSRYRIAKDCGIDQSAISRFMSGERGMNLSDLDKIAAYLGLEITQRRKPNTKERSK